MEARKAIETQMEQFKQCEKETKTKAYSKEGLMVAQQKDDAKDTCRTWISKCLDSLQQQHDKVETEIEQLKAKKVESFVWWGGWDGKKKKLTLLFSYP